MDTNGLASLTPQRVTRSLQFRTKIKPVSSQEGGTLRFPALLSERDGAGIPALLKPAEFEVMPMDV